MYKNTDMTAAEALRHLRYSGWASRKMLDAAKGLSPEDLSRPTGISHGSILGTLCHIHFADRIWYARVVDSQEPLIREGDLAALERDWIAIQRKWEAWAAALTDADVSRIVRYQTLDGKQS